MSFPSRECRYRVRLHFGILGFKLEHTQKVAQLHVPTKFVLRADQRKLVLFHHLDSKRPFNSRN